jgi:hypothetical protein
MTEKSIRHLSCHAPRDRTDHRSLRAVSAGQQSGQLQSTPPILALTTVPFATAAHPMLVAPGIELVAKRRSRAWR